LETWHHYLHGSHFTVLTDQQALSWLLNQQKIQGKLAKYLNILSILNFDIEYRKRFINTVVDALSRPSIQENIEQNNKVEYTNKYEYKEKLPMSLTELINNMNKIIDNEEEQITENIDKLQHDNTKWSIKYNNKKTEYELFITRCFHLLHHQIIIIIKN